MSSDNRIPQISTKNKNFSTDDLPLYLRQDQATGLLWTSGDIEEGRDGSYDAIFDYRTSRQKLRELVPPDQRVMTNSGDGRIWYAGFENPDVVRAMRSITQINKTASPDNEMARLQYQSQLCLALAPVAKRVSQDIIGRPVFVPPLQGGALIRAFYQHYGVIKELNDVVGLELKRVLLKTGDLLVGANIRNYPIGDYETLVVIDDCLASDISADTCIRLGLEQYPKINKVIVAVSAATHRGMEVLNREWSPKIDLTLLAALPVFAMSHNYYLLRTTEEGYPTPTQFVGDMGKWSRRLDQKHNRAAPWNKFM